MPTFDCDKLSIDAVIRYTWRVTILIFMLFILLPVALSLYFKSHGADQYDQNINILDMMSIIGGLTSLSFLFISFRFSATKNRMAGLSVSRICIFIKSRLIFTFAYWSLFFYLSLSGKDGDGIMRGWMIILYPFFLVPKALRLSKG